MRYRTVTLLALAASVLLAVEVYALDTTIRLGGSEGWAGATIEGLVFADEPGRSGPLSLMPYQHESDPDTEFLLGFDSVPINDAAGSFAVRAPNAEISYSTRRSGRAALLVDSPDDVVRLIPAGTRYFQSGVEWGSFVLEFWLYPVTLSDGERILEWNGSEGPDLNFRPQQVRVSVENRRLQFRFVNFFVPNDQSALTVTLEGTDGLIPRSWSHHQVRFNAETGLLEYLIDGVTNAVTHVSRSGREDGSVFFPRMAAFAPEEIDVVPNFTGAVDEIRLLRRDRSDAEEPIELANPWFDPGGGVYESGVLDLGSPGAVLNGIVARDRVPGMADIFYYVKIADMRSGANQLPGEWEPVAVTGSFQARSGRFVQVRAELYPDPAIALSPELLGVDLNYTPDPPPFPPSGLQAEPGDGQVRLSWSPVRQEDIRGYLVYYGTQPGRYFATEADSGPSPIDVGQATSITLTGLANGTLYYFAVGAYDVSGAGSTIELSSEVAARPARVYR